MAKNKKKIHVPGEEYFETEHEEVEVKQTPKEFNINYFEDKDWQKQAIPYNKKKVLVRQDVLYCRLNYTELKVPKKEASRFSSCFLLKSKEAGGVNGYFPSLYLSEIWRRVKTDEKGDARNVNYGVSQDEWDNFCKKIIANVQTGNINIDKTYKENLSDELPIWYVFYINEFAFRSLNVQNLKGITSIIKDAIELQIKMCQRVSKRWHKIKNYKHFVSLDERYGGIFGESDCKKLRAKGIKSLNDIKDHSIYELCNMHLHMPLDKIIEKINEAFKEDLEKRKDFRYKFWPLAITNVLMVSIITCCAIFGFTLLKSGVTYYILSALFIWLVAFALMIHGMRRAVKRRRTKVPRYRFFTAPVVCFFVLFCLFSTAGITSSTICYEKYDNYDDTYYYREVDGGYEVAGLRKNLTTYHIPETVNLSTNFTDNEEKEIVRIDKEVFRGAKDIEYVTIPESVEFVDDYLFKDCTNLLRISAKGLKTVSKGMFANCVSLTTLDLPNVTKIEEKAFDNCDNLVSVTFENVTEVNDGAFANCFNLNSISLPQVTVIEKGTFESCISLSNIQIPNVTCIEENAFKMCGSLVSLTFENVTEIKSGAFASCNFLNTINLPKVTVLENGLFENCSSLMNVNANEVTTIKDRTFAGCDNLLTVNLEKLTSIGQYAFEDCENLYSVNYIENVESIGKGAFSGCKDYSTITFDKVGVINKDIVENTSFRNITFGPSISEIQAGVFNDNQILQSISFSNNDVKLGKGAFKDCMNLMTVENFNSTLVSESCFENCISLNSINFGDGVKEIDKRAFYGSALNNVIFSDSVETIREEAFAYCDSLATLNVPQTVTKIEKNAFAENEFESITIPYLGETRDTKNPKTTHLFTDTKISSLTIGYLEEINENTFISMYNTLESLNIESGLEKVEDYSFAGFVLSAIELPNSVQEIGKSAFKDCSSLITVVAPQLTTIEDGAFSGCSSLVNIDGSQVTSIGQSAFKSCYSLKTINIPKVTEIKDKTFIDCIKLTRVNCAQTTAIGQSAFMDCVWLTTISTSNVATIEDGAFSGCSKLTNLDLSQLTSIGKSAFKNCASLATINAPKLTSIEDEAFSGCGNLVSATCNQLKSIGNSAFKNCTELNTINALSLTAIGEEAFYDCVNLANTNFSQIETIGKSAFRNCASLVTISALKVTTIGDQAFYGCTNLANITFDKLTSIGNYALARTDITNLVIPSGVKTIGEGILNSCDIKNLTVPFIGRTADDATHVSYLTDNDTLESITITDAKIICERAFADMYWLTKVTIRNEKNTIKTFDAYAFANSYVQEIVMPDKFVKNLKGLPGDCIINGKLFTGNN